MATKNASVEAASRACVGMPFPYDRLKGLRLKRAAPCAGDGESDG